MIYLLWFVEPNSGLGGNGGFGRRRQDRFGLRLAIVDGTIGCRLAPTEKRKKVAATTSTATTDSTVAFVASCPIAEQSSFVAVSVPSVVATRIPPMVALPADVFHTVLRCGTWESRVCTKTARIAFILALMANTGGMSRRNDVRYGSRFCPESQSRGCQQPNDRQNCSVCSHFTPFFHLSKSPPNPDEPELLRTSPIPRHFAQE
jgi:hypothetical protein